MVTKPMGWKKDPAAVRRVLARLPFPHFERAARNLKGSGAGQTVLISNAVKKVLGKHMGAQDQPRGTCVSRGWSRGVDYLACAEIAILGEPEEFKYVSHSFIYGCSREIGGDLSSEDGSVGAWAAEAVNTMGNITNDDCQDRDANYDDLAVQWASRGVPQQYKDLAKQRNNKVQTVSLVKTPEAARDAICNYYPVPVCSGQGFSMTRDSNGHCRAEGSWAHCVPPETMIAGPMFRRADEVKVGDMVYGHDGKAHAVKEVFVRPFHGTTVRIKAAGIPAVQFTDEHPVMVYRRALRTHGTHRHAKLAVGTSVAPTDSPTYHAATMRYEPAWVMAKDVRPGDRVLTPRLQPQVPVPSPFEPSDELAWLFGFYIGDGYAVRDHKIVLTLSLRDPVDRFVAAFRVIGLKATVKEHETFRRVIVYSAKLANSFIECFGSGSENKRIPDWLMTWNPSPILEGLLQADGCDYKGRRIYTTVSPILAEQVRLLIIAIGERPAVTIKEPGKGAYVNGKTQHVITWTPDGKDRKVTNAAGFAMYVVQSVFLLPYDGDVYNYEVEDVHSYVADGIAVHNCMVWTGYRDDKKQFLVEQSWGPNTPDGPLGDLDIPDNAFWIDWDVGAQMLAEEDSFAMSQFAGFPAQKLSWVL